ncbi:hypothetical protein BDN70DRAFT_383954 [Pholiota conissans]|uniref:Heterokaryon incompatibility domain-containing protein n=1 Tax=Pholiota conissans TaxID=109636 RepID=A0A9P6CTX6_9AGAR|nr:hypothetical protein BDN70DRAFT_383954 [Pholiota conissans]
MSYHMYIHMQTVRERSEGSLVMKESARLLNGCLRAHTASPSSYHHLLAVFLYSSQMIYRIFNSCQNLKVHRTAKTHRLGDSTDTTDEVKLDTRSEDIEKDAQILLTALRNLIVPLVQSVVPNASAEFDGRPEEKNLLIALQNYVTSIIGGQDQADNRDEKRITRVVNLKALNVPKAPEKPKDGVSHNTYKIQEKLRHHKQNVVRFNFPVGPRTGDAFELGNLLEVLREQVFNLLPIRLLRFERLDNTDMLRISLLDQAEIYSSLARQFAHTYISIQVDDSTRWNQLNAVTRYAILSHTWLRSTPGELSYDVWNKRSKTFDLTHPGYEKLVQFCRASLLNHGVSLGWMDTVCIDKASSSELDESIRSMYKWYQNSFMCITYLSETETLSQLAKDPWFSRGWTLQELLAPDHLKFYNRTWGQLTAEPNDKYDENIQEQIKIATTITTEELLANHLIQVPISRKMQWAAKRQVTRAEDIAYSLMGLFDISMSIAYGEGAKLAFSRLIKEILGNCKYDILDVFNWGGEYMTRISTLLPSSPQAFLERDDLLDVSPILMEPLTLTHMGLRVPVLIVPTKVAISSVTARYNPKGDYFSSVSPNHPEGFILPSVQGGQKFDFSCNVLDFEAFRPRVQETDRRYAFAVLNCTGDEHNIDIPLFCFAILIRYIVDDILLTPIAPIDKVASIFPIIFPLRKIPTELETATDNHLIRREELGCHGMQSLSMYI